MSSEEAATTVTDPVAGWSEGAGVADGDADAAPVPASRRATTAQAATPDDSTRRVTHSAYGSAMLLNVKRPAPGGTE
jgi:hypothetical protein